MLNGRKHLEDLDREGMILICILEKLDRWVWMGLMWHRTGLDGRFLCTCVVNTTQGIS
jgi:hypothetical protein